MTGTEPCHVVIVGAGFGGLNVARALKGAPALVTLIDRHNYHLFQPLLYQVATAVLNPSEVATPVRRILRNQRNARVLLAEAVSVDTDARRVILKQGTLQYDYLVLAPGAAHSYFGHDDWARNAPGLKTVDDALAIRRRVLLAFEAAERETNPDLRRQWLTFVIVGGGPTGVELAGALAEMGRLMRRDFRAIDPSHVRVVLVEGLDHVLPGFVPELSRSAEAQLKRLGVEVRTGTMVTRVDQSAVSFGSERLDAKTILWAAGVIASPLAGSLGVPLDKAGRVQVGPALTAPGHEDVFVIGDLAASEQNGKPLPGIAPVAIQQGIHTGRNIVLAALGHPLQPFLYRDKGLLATIGKGAAVAQLPWVRISGLPAWFLWLGVHIFYLIGFRNRILVAAQWIWAYLNRERAARLITGDSP